jgi:signal transduction histidine kinase/ActR/RegA family two-component response regulator
VRAIKGRSRAISKTALDLSMPHYLRSARTLVPLLAGFVVLAVSVLAGAWIFERQQIASQWVRHTLEVQKIISDIALGAADAETGSRGYLLTGDSAYVDSYDEAISPMSAEVDALAKTTADNPRQRAAIEKLRPAVRAKIDALNHTVALMRAGQTEGAQAFVHTGHGREAMATLRAILDGMLEEENRLLAIRAASMQRSVALGRLVWLCSAAAVLLLSVFVVWDARRRIHVLQETNQRLANEASARKVAQGQVHQLQKMQAVGQLTGGIAHDFNNMLAIVIGSLDIALRRLSGSEHPQLSPLMRTAADGAKKAAALTSRLLAFARQQPLEPKVADANKLVAQMSEILRRTLGETVQLETVLAGGLWQVFVDPAQIESSLVNLCLNASDAMRGGGRLTIETANTELDDQYARTHDEVVAGQYVMLSVTDTGTGMTPEVLDRAFEPFYTTKGVGQGSGLGLSQVFGFLKQSKGHVKIYSELGHGTCVKLYLPRYLTTEIQMSHKPALRSLMPVGSGEETILVVEDEREVRATSVAALQELGYKTLEAASGQEALSVIEGASGVDLLFTDIVMPEMSGRQLAEAVLRIRPTIKVLYTTGYTRNAIVHNGVVDSNVSFLAKPFSIDALARKVRAVLDAKSGI